MELESNFMEIQDLLRNCSKTIGDLSKFKYKGGNEMKISCVIKKLETFLQNKSLLKEHKIVQELYQPARRLTYFLMINSDFKCDITEMLTNLAHLKVCPTLSVCLLANIIAELDLIECFTDVVNDFPVEVAKEVMEELIPCLKKTSAHNLHYSYLCVKQIMDIVCKIDKTQIKNKEIAESLIDIAIEIISAMSRITTEQVEEWSKQKIYTHMGQTVLKLFLLLEECNKEDPFLIRILLSIEKNAIDILKAVTITVFIAWAEVTINDQCLQTLVQEKAYFIMQKYQNFEATKQLISMLAPVARKPKSIQEQIREADLDTIVSNINKADKNQKKWFSALLNTRQVFEDAKAIECLEKWCHLCSVQDVSRILDLSIHLKNSELKEIVVKCLDHLQADDIVLITTRFYSTYTFKYNFESKQMQNKLKLILNQMQYHNEFEKELIIVCFQNPPIVLGQIYAECIKSNVYSKCLKSFFVRTVGVFQINNLNLKLIEDMATQNPPTNDNILNYRDLFNLLLESQQFTWIVLIMQYFKPSVVDAYENTNFEKLKSNLFLINALGFSTRGNQITSDEVVCFINYILNILDNVRVNFFEFSNLKMDINEELVALLSEYIRCISKEYCDIDTFSNITANHFMNKYYSDCLRNKMELPLFQTVFTTFNVEDYSECVAKIIKILPSCVLKEWLTLVDHLSKQMELNKCAELLTDVLILLCELTSTQDSSEATSSILPAFKHCLQFYGIAIKDIILPNMESKSQGRILKHVCRLLKEIPTVLREEEGFKLISLFSDNTFQTLKHDKPFVISLVAIDNISLSQLIAKKVLA